MVKICPKCGGNMFWIDGPDMIQCHDCGYTDIQCDIKGSLEYNRAKRRKEQCSKNQ